jgi:hypothetical protein
MRTRRGPASMTVLLIGCFGVLSLAAAVDITGKWAASFDTPIGQMNYTYDFVVKDGLLTGKVHSSTFGESEVLEGKVDGDKVTFVEMLDGSIRVEYTGKIVSADEIAFMRKVGDFGTEELTAKRAKQ